MKIKNIHTVKAKLILSILTATLVIVLFVGYYFPEEFKKEQITFIADKAKTTASIIASEISASIFFNDPDALSEDLNKLLKYEEVGYLIVKSEGKVLYNYNIKDAAKYKYEILSEVGDIGNEVFFKTSAQVNVRNIHVGTLYLGIRLASLNEHVSEIKKNILIVNLIILAIGALSALLIGYIFTKPIHQLIAAADEVKKGNFKARTEIKTHDEIGYLGKTFNGMIDTIDELYSEMGKKVLLRTRELEETNLRLEHEILQRKKDGKIIKNSLEEKIILLKEIHHRVKNNLQVISSLLYLQSNKIDDPETKEYFNESRNRIVSMALVHENLYKNDDLSRVDFSNYIINLIKNLDTFYSSSTPIKIHTELDNVFLSVNIAVPLALILNELLTNAYKHAFTELSSIDDSEKKLWINLRNGSNINVEVIDNGRGLADDFDPDSGNSLGMKIINSLIAQIDATLKYENAGGAKFTIVINQNLN